MSIEKINLSAVNTTPQSSQKPNNEKNELHTDKQLSNSAKYMLGATALAAIAIGIIGHKNNWWKKGTKVIDDVRKPNSTPTAQKTENIAPQTTPDIPNEVPKSQYNYTRTEIKDGYILECEATGKKLKKTINPHAQQSGHKYNYVYTQKLENGNTVRISKGMGQYDENHFVRLMDVHINNKDGIELYAFVDQHTERIFDFENMMLYRVNPSNKDLEKIKITLDGKKIVYNGNIEAVSLEEFNTARKKVLDKLLPPKLNKVKNKFLNSFEHIIESGNKRFVRQGDYKSLHETISEGWIRTTTKESNGRYQQIITHDSAVNMQLYRKIRNKIGNDIIETETITILGLPNILFRKSVNVSSNEITYTLNDKAIPAQRFEDLKELIFSNIGKKTGKRTFKPRYEVELNPDGTVYRYIKYDENGKRIEVGIQDLKNETMFMITPADENQKPIKELRKILSYDKVDFSELIEDQRKFGLMM